MKIEITGKPKEIAALILAIQERRSDENIRHNGKGKFLNGNKPESQITTDMLISQI